MTTRIDEADVPDVDLQRFIDAQRDSFERALDEIETGRKTSHWMWFVFPQVSGLGLSATSRRYAIGGVEEAKAFLTHAVLGARYRRIVDAVWQQVVERGVTVRELFGSPDDAKLVSSLTLFSGVAGRLDSRQPDLVAFVDRTEAILRAAHDQGLIRCVATEEFIADR
jgi:uncharacterized protein (DUF1810 family)